MPRCCINVFDKASLKTRKCLHNRKWGSLCSLHARPYVVKIQSAWRAHRTKTKINVYKHLPTDVWEIILNFIQYRNNIYKIYMSHATIYKNRMTDLQSNYIRLMVVYGRFSPKAWCDLYNSAEVNLKYFNKLLDQ